MPCVGFEPTIPASERAKAVHALDRAATVTGRNIYKVYKIARNVKYISTCSQYCELE
jgi:hypothetical protein